MIRFHSWPRCALSIFLLATAACVAQNATATRPAARQDATGTLTPAEKAQFDAAGRLFNAEKFADALPLYKALLAAHPGNPLLSKFAAESAINTGDDAYAVGLLEPIEQANANDWQAVGLLARAYAESGDKAHRDAEMQRMADLYKSGVVPARLQQYLIEKAQAGDKTVRICQSLHPWGRYNVYNYARVFDSSGTLLSRITLESSDFDQPQFVKEHPDEAAKGVRIFSFDGYAEGPVNANGMRTETHATYDLFTSQGPSYDTVRAAFLNIAQGKSARQETSIFGSKPAAQ